MQLGEISLDVILNRNSINAAVQDLRSQIRDVNLQINPQVNHRELTELNQHLDKKVKHVREVNAYFQLNPLTPQVDTRKLQELKSITDVIAKQSNSQIKILLKNDIQTANRKQQTSQIVKALNQIDKSVKRNKTNGILQGIQQGIGNEIARGINKQVKESFGFRIAGLGKIATETISKPVNFIAKDNPELKAYLDKQVDRAGKNLRAFYLEIGAAAVDSLERTLPLNSPMKTAEDFFRTYKPDINLSEFTANFKSSFESELKDLTTSVFSQTKLKTILKPVDRFLRDFRTENLKTSGLDLVQKRAAEILNQKRVKNSANLVTENTQELIIASGGYAGARGLSGAALAKDFNKEQVPGRQAIWIKNEDSDIPADSDESSKAAMLSLAKPILRGFSKDAVEMAAQAYAASFKNPEVKIKLVGESGGGFVAEEASKMLDLLNVKNDFIGTGTPNFIGGFDTKNRKILSPDEGLGRQTHTLSNKFGLVNLNASQNILGVEQHGYRDYSKSNVAELQNFFKGHPGDITPQQLGSYKGTADKLKNVPYEKFDLLPVEQAASLSVDMYEGLQTLRRFILDAADDEKAFLKKMVADFESIYINLQPAPPDIQIGRELKQGLQKRLIDARENPTIDNASATKSILKSLETAQKALQEQYEKSAGITKVKFQQLISEYDKLREEFDKPFINYVQKPLTIPLQVPKIPESVLVNNQPQSQPQKIAAPLVNQVAPVQEKELKALSSAEKSQELEKARKIAAQFSTSYKDIARNIKDDFATSIQKTASILENTQRAKKEIVALRDSLGDEGKIGTPQGNSLNQTLGQISKVEKNLKRTFAKIKSPNEEVQKIASEIVNGISLAIAGEENNLSKIAATIPETLINKTKEDLEIKSPSRVFYRLGLQVVEGIKKGVDTVKQKGIFEFLKGEVATFVNEFTGLFLLQKSFSVLEDLTPVLKETALGFEQLDTSLLFVTGSTSKAESAFKSLRNQAKELGLDLRSSADAYVSLASATKDTSLEGVATDQIFKGIQEASAVRRLTLEQQQGVNLAISQIASKGTVQQEELRGQLGERISGAQQIAARSRGQSVQELNRDIRKGIVTAEEFLPAFAQQLSAESALALPSVLDSSTAATNRFNNVVIELQNTLGKPILEFEKIGLNLLTPILEKLIVLTPLFVEGLNFLALTLAMKYLPMVKQASIFTLDLLFNLKGGGSVLKALSTQLGLTALKFAAFLSVVEVFKAISVAIKDASGDLKTFADVSANGLKVYKDSLNPPEEKDESAFKDSRTISSYLNPSAFTSGFTPELINQEGTKKLKESAIGRGLLRFLPDTLEKDASLIEKAAFTLRSSVQSLEGNFIDYSAKAKEDRLKQIAKLKTSNEETNNEVDKILSSSSSPLNQIQSIDKNLDKLQMQRRALSITNPSDVQTLKQIKTLEEDLLQQRESGAKSVALLQNQNSITIESIKKAIDETERLALIPSNYQQQYRDQSKQLRESLKKAEDAQIQLNRAIKKGVDSFGLFIDRANSIQDILGDSKTVAGTQALGFKTQINQLNTFGNLTNEQSSNLNSQVELQASINELSQINKAINELTQLLAERQDVLSTYGVQKNTGVNSLQRLNEQIENPKDKQVIEKFIELKQLQTQSSEIANNVSQQQATLAQSLKDTAKEVALFYKELTATSAQLIQESKQIKNTVALNSAKGKLKTALLGQQDSFVSSYVEGLIGILESLNQPLQQALQSQQQMLSNYQSALSQQTQLKDIQNRTNLLQVGQLNFNQAQGLNNVESAFNSSQYSKGVLRPVNEKFRVSSGYGMRNHPVLGGQRMHHGIDYAAPKGTPVLAPTAGVVSYAGALGAAGNTVKIKSTDAQGRQIEQMFLHLSSFAVKVGDAVKQGQKLGGVGTTGRSTGNHLDWRLKINGKWVNPNSFLNSNVVIGSPNTPKNESAFNSSQSTRSTGGGKYASTQNKLTDQFLKGTAQAAQKLGTKPEYLLAVMGFETGGTYSPKKTNSGGYTGLIQFSPKYSPGNVGKSTAQLRNMSQMEQLQYVPKYIDKNRMGKNVSSLENLYMSVLMPMLVGKGKNAKLPGWAYGANKGLDINRDGAISVAESTSKVKDYLPNAETMRRLYGSSPRQNESAFNSRNTAINFKGTSESAFNSKLDLSSLNVNQSEIKQANQQIIDNYMLQNKGIQEQLQSANQLAKLEAQLQKQANNNQFETSLRGIEENISSTSRRLKDLGTAEAVTPQQRIEQEKLQVNREFFDLNKGLVTQDTELQSAFDTLTATKNVIQQGGFQGADVLQAELPTINDGLIRLKRAIEQTESAFNSSEKARLFKLNEIDKKYEKEKFDNLRQFNLEARRNEITRLRNEANVVESQLGGNIGGKGRGDVLKLRKDASELEILTNTDEQIANLQVLQDKGERTSSQVSKLKLQLEAFQSQDLEINNIKYATELRQRLLQIEERDLAIKTKRFGFEQGLTEELAKNADFAVEKNPLDTSRGEPMVIRYQASLKGLQQELVQARLEIKQFAESQNLSAEETKNLNEQVEILFNLRRQNLKQDFNRDYERNKIESAFNVRDKTLTTSNKFSDDSRTLNELNINRATLFQQGKPFDFSQGNPIDLKYVQDLKDVKRELESLTLEAEKFAYSQTLSKEETEKLLSAIKESNQLKLENLTTDYKLQKAEQLRAIKQNETSKINFKNDSDINLLGGVSEAYSLFGRTTEVNKLQKEISKIQLNQQFKTDLDALEEFARTTGLSTEKVELLRSNLERLQDIKLDNLNNQFSPFTEIAKTGVDSLQQGIAGLIQGTMSLGDVFNTIGLNISSTLTKIASELVTNEIISGIFGNKQFTAPISNQGAGVGGLIGNVLNGGAGGLLGSILGFSQGGKVPNVIYPGSIESAFNPQIATALRKEGSNAVLATLTPGEQVLNLNEAELYRQMFPNGISNIAGFKAGGVVGNVSNKVMGKSESAFNINVPVTVSGNVDENFNANQLGFVIKAAVVNEIKKQQNPGGLLSQ